jgi:hypothetical protein
MNLGATVAQAGTRLRYEQEAKANLVLAKEFEELAARELTNLDQDSQQHSDA